MIFFETKKISRGISGKGKPPLIVNQRGMLYNSQSSVEWSLEQLELRLMIFFNLFMPEYPHFDLLELD